MRMVGEMSEGEGRSEGMREEMSKGRREGMSGGRGEGLKEGMSEGMTERVNGIDLGSDVVS